jgi:hypothetical protein
MTARSLFPSSCNPCPHADTSHTFLERHISVVMYLYFAKKRHSVMHAIFGRRPVWQCLIRTALMSSQPAPALRYLLVLDFEATCGNNIKQESQEIIEFPTLLYNLQEDKVEATFHEYVRPIRHQTLTGFCTDLTGITQVRFVSRSESRVNRLKNVTNCRRQ